MSRDSVVANLRGDRVAGPGWTREEVADGRAWPTGPWIPRKSYVAALDLAKEAIEAGGLTLEADGTLTKKRPHAYTITYEAAGNEHKTFCTGDAIEDVWTYISKTLPAGCEITSIERAG